MLSYSTLKPKGWPCWPTLARAMRGTVRYLIPGKVFSKVILNRIRPRLLAYQRPEQSDYTPKKSTMDKNSVFRVLIERRREFRKQFLQVYAYIKKAFDLVHLYMLWGLLRHG